MELCSLASSEQAPKKLAELIKEINWMPSWLPLILFFFWGSLLPSFGR